MAHLSRDELTKHASFREYEMSTRASDPTSRRLRHAASTKRPPHAHEGECSESSNSVRRARTVPSELAEEDGVAGERRSRRNLSRLFSDEFGDDVLVDSSKRVRKTASDRKLTPMLSKKSGKAATPLDIPFAPNPELNRTFSAGMEDLETEVSRVGVRRTRTDEQMEERSSPRPVYRSASVKVERRNRPKETLTSTRSGRGVTFANETNQDPKTSSKGKTTKGQEMALTEREKEEHVINVDLHPEKKMTPPRKSPKKLVKASSSKKSRSDEPEKVLPPLTLMEWLLHFIGLIFVQYPFKHHKQWLEKMYKTKRLVRPKKNEPGPEVELNTAASTLGTLRGRTILPTLSENGTHCPLRNPRMRRRTQLDGDGPRDDLNAALERGHGKRCSRHSRQFSTVFSKTPGPLSALPITENPPEEKPQRRKGRKSVEIFGDILHSLGITKGGRLKTGLSEMDENELSGFQARLYKFIKRQHKGRLARAWDHMINPLGSLQKKHRRSPNKTRLLAAIDKHKAHKFDSGLDAFGTRVFLVSQWVFEALSPPKYTKKPMLFTVLFPLVLILLFGFMAGEYPYWLATNGEAIDDYKFGPEEISSWLFRTESWRVFDDAFLITWGGRYLPLVETEGWRWIFSMLIHEHFAHIGGNLLLFVVLSWPLESKYGLSRTGLICLISGICGNFMSAALEDECGIVLGASGCVFGLAAFYVMDVIGDFKHVSFPCLRLIGICTFLSAFIIALTSHQEASHISHIGGFLCGMTLSVVLVPRFIDERIEAFLPWVALFSAMALLCGFPIFVFTSVIPNLQCSS